MEDHCSAQSSSFLLIPTASHPFFSNVLLFVIKRWLFGNLVTQKGLSLQANTDEQALCVLYSQVHPFPQEVHKQYYLSPLVRIDTSRIPIEPKKQFFVYVFCGHFATAVMVGYLDSCDTPLLGTCPIPALLCSLPSYHTSTLQ